MSRGDDDSPPDTTPLAPDPMEFPALEDFFLGYLHEDFEAIYGGPEAAMDAFIGDIDPADCAAVLREWAVLRARLQCVDEERKLAAIAQLGAAWTPGSWAEVESLFQRLSD